MEIFRRSCFVLGGYHPGGEKKKKKKIEAITNTSMAVAGNCLLCENCWKKKKRFFFARAIRTDLSTNFRSLFFPFSSRCDIVALFWESETLEFVYLFIYFDSGLSQYFYNGIIFIFGWLYRAVLKLYGERILYCVLNMLASFGNW